MTAGITWLGKASHSWRHRRMRSPPAVVSGPPSGAIVPPDLRTMWARRGSRSSRPGNVGAGQPVGGVILRPTSAVPGACQPVGALAGQVAEGPVEVRVDGHPIVSSSACERARQAGHHRNCGPIGAGRPIAPVLTNTLVYK